MIILDSNILRSFKLDSVSSDLLKTIRTAGVESGGVPWVVLEELASHRAVPYREKYEAASEALASFRKATPWQVATLLPPLDLERFQQHWRDQYREIADEIPTSEAALREATWRESNILPPCKAIVVNERGEKVKTGGRDAAIWLTAVEYAWEHPDETVYFVSKNTKDFGDGTAYPPLMAKDLENLGDRFVHLTSLGEVLQRVTESAEVDDEEVRAILSDAESLKAISADAAHLMVVTTEKIWLSEGPRFEAAMAFLAEDLGSGEFETVTTEPVQILGWTEPPTVVLHSMGELSAHRIADHVWCAATVRWILSGPAILANTHRVEVVGCAWETRILASTTNPNSEITILRSQSPRALSTPEFVAFAPSASALAERREHARTKPALRKLSAQIERTGRALTRLERTLMVRNDNPWVAVSRADDDHALAHWMARDASPWLVARQEGDLNPWLDPEANDDHGHSVRRTT
ncbi:PIN domain-containing protein [Streptomyces sp. NBC_00104]|uniref:PIN domain-containing protein n=1 Tax=Streptomyces sp. NBC_00104 TaxID=2903621 RepID=UPI0032541682